MGLLSVVLEALWYLIRGIGFVFKIFFSYFFKCFFDVAVKIADEWHNRELDDEIY